MIARLTLLVLGLALTACVESSAAQSGRLSRGSSLSFQWKTFA
jgi:hypothetical protein